MVEGHRYWRPEEPVPSGTLLEFSHEGCETGDGYDAPFRVRVEGRWLPPRIDFTSALSLVLDEQAPAGQVSCGMDEALLVEAGYCACAECECAFPEREEVTIALAEAWRGKVRWFDDAGALSADQVLLRQVEWFGEPTPESGWLRINHWAGPSARNIEVAEEPLCTTFELLVVPTGERTELTRCVDPPAEPLGGQPVVARFPSVGGIESCTMPPEGHEAAWCVRYRSHCESLGVSEETRILCRHHYELCGSEPPGPGSDAVFDGAGGVFGAGGSTGGSSTGGSSTGGASRGGARATRCSGETDPIIGCSAAARPPALGIGGTAGGLFLFLAYAGLVRCRRCRARDLGSS